MVDSTASDSGDNSSDTPTSTPTPTDSAGRVPVDVVAKDGDGQSLLATLTGLGLQNGASYGALVSGFADPELLVKLSAIGGAITLGHSSRSSTASTDPLTPEVLASILTHVKGESAPSTPVPAASDPSTADIGATPSRFVGSGMSTDVVNPEASTPVRSAGNDMSTDVAPSEASTPIRSSTSNGGMSTDVYLPPSGGTGAQPVTSSAPSQASTDLSALPQRAAAVLNSNGQQAIDVIASDGNGAALLGQLQQMGLQGGASFGNMVSGFIDPAKMASISALSGVVSASVSSVTTSAGKVTNEADHSLMADTERANLGFDGTGVKIGILSDSFNTATNTNGDTLATDQASGDLPANVTILNDYTGTDATDEGRAMGQIIHDIAPGASLVFDTAFGGQAVYAQHILDLAAAGCKVIVDDVYSHTELSYQDGVIAQAVAKVKAMGVTYLSSAGNQGANGYEGSFNTGTTPVSFTYTDPNNNNTTNTYTLDQFAPGVTRLPVTLTSSEDFVLQWSQPGASAGGKGATSNLALFLTDSSGNVVANLAETGASIGGDPVQDLGISGGSGSTYYLEVGLQAGSAAPADIRLLSTNFNAKFGTVAGETNINNGTFYGHHSSPSTIAVAAAGYTQTPAYNNAAAATLEPYSTQGVDYIYYDTAGNPIQMQTRAGPNVTGVDGGETTFFTGSARGPNGYPEFFGTSAAAPSVAAVAALMLQKNPNLTPDQIKSILQSTATAAVDSTGASNSRATGAGLVNALAAVNATPVCYATGTGIATTRGRVQVEDLAIGDVVVTASGEHRAIRWLGRRSYSGIFANRNPGLLPVCFKAGSLGENLPQRDLCVSPKHAMFIDGLLVPAECLVNGVSVTKAARVESIGYHHVELDSHDVLLAEGAPSESFIDDEGREFFHNADEHAALYPDAVRTEALYCAPRLEDGFALEAIRRRIAQRAGLVAEAA